MKEQLVAITYIAGESQGAELKLAVAGWKKHFKTPHKIVIVGDKPPMEDVEWLPVDRLPEKDGEYRPHLDIAHKLESVTMYYADRYSNFIWASDDCYAVNDFTIDDVIIPKIQDMEMPSKGESHFNPWWRNVVKTRKACERDGLGVVNWVTHLPLYFNFRDLINLIWNYRLTSESYVIENLYYNKYTPKQKPILLCEGDRWKFGVYFTPLDRNGFDNAIANKIWIYNSVHGWSPELEAGLLKHYGL